VDNTELVALEEQQAKIRFNSLRVSRAADSWFNCPPSSDWTQRYKLGKELGSGQTAVVHEAWTIWPTDMAVTPRNTPRSPRRSNSPRSPRNNAPRNGAEDVGSRGSAAPPTKRRVALKKFATTGSTMFQQELKALRAVGIHPHVLRLLESFQGPREDVLILEFCSGGDVYEVYASNHGCCMLEAFVLHLLRQLLLALQHIFERGVEHRDIKPENLLLYSSSDSTSIPHLKLADFGWAQVLPKGGRRPQVPYAGVGSLWYASPELNPPAEGVPVPNGAETAPIGSSDMWSVGIITYLLLLGHSPFNVALRETDQAAREVQVIRLAASAEVNKDSRAWSCLSSEAQDFILKLIQVDPARRMSPQQAWNHPFLAQGSGNKQSTYLAKVPALLPVADVVWKRLDGFQRLCWITFARAIAEPELVQVRSFQMFITQQSMGGTKSYLEALAIQLAAVAAPSWFQRKTAWMDPLRLAFCYLDVDTDGVVSAQDLSQHIVFQTDADEGEALKLAEKWVQRWSQGGANNSGNGSTAGSAGLSFLALKWALSASYAHAADAPSQDTNGANGTSSSNLTLSPDGDGTDSLPKVANAHTIKDRENVMLKQRMHAVDEMCQRFLDEEFDDFGFGF
jgi:serine/threonine protein kinase